MKLSVRMKLILACGALAALPLFGGIMGSWQVRAVNAILTGETVTYSNARFHITEFGQIVGEFNDVHSEYLLNVYSDKSDKAALRAERVRFQQSLEEALDETEQWANNAESRARLEKVRSAFAAFDEAGLSMLETRDSELARPEEPSQGSARMIVYDGLRTELYAAIKAFNIYQEQQLEISTQSAADHVRNVIRVLIGLTVLGLIIAAGIIWFAIRMIDRPITALMAAATAVTQGNVTYQIEYRSSDEFGQLADTFRDMITYLTEMAGHFKRLAAGDLTTQVEQRSNEDVLGMAATQMVASLRMLIENVSKNANEIHTASEQLASVANQSGQATSQVAATIQQVAKGIMQQSQDISGTSHSVEQINRAIHAVAKGAQKQAQAVHQTSSMAAQISSAMQQATVNAQSGARGAREAANAASSGAQTIKATIAGMQTIKTKVGLSAQKVSEMGQRSEQINAIVETIDEIASQTNLLALNAAIEAARVESKGEKTVESILQQHLQGAASLVAELLAAGRELHSKDLEELARRAEVEQFSISDADGVIVAASNPRSLGFRFSEDPSHQSSVFRPLLKQREGVVVQPIRARDQDGKPFVFVGISRRDRPGIVQAGIAGDVVYRLGGYSRGFAVVADEIRKLAEHAKTSTKEIALLIRTIQKSVREAVGAMEDGLRDVESRSAQATEAGESLATIIKTVESVNRQVGEIAEAITHMESSSRDLVSGMGAVSAVVEEDIAATGEMAVNSNELTQAVENIASVSEENSAAVEEVSASTEEVSAQVEQVYGSAASLIEMAQNLQQVVAQFKLNLATEEIPSVPEPVTPIA